MNLHRRRSVLVRMTPEGERLGQARISNSPAALRAEIAKAGVRLKVVLEATYRWYWAADTLALAGAEVHLAHPLGVKAFTYRRVKNDERDAADLADLLRMSRLPEAWIAPTDVRDLREPTRYRTKLVGLRTSCKDQVHAVLAKLGSRSPTRTCSARPAPRGWTSSPCRSPTGQDRLAAVADRDLHRGDCPSGGKSSPSCCAATPGMPRSSRCRGSARSWPRSSPPRSETSPASPARPNWRAGPGLPRGIASPTSRSPAASSPSRAHRPCGGRWSGPSSASSPAPRSGRSKTASSPAAASRTNNIANVAAARHLAVLVF